MNGTTNQFFYRNFQQAGGGGGEETEEIELSLGLSLNGRFGVDPERANKLKRSSSIPDFLNPTGKDFNNYNNNESSFLVPVGCGNLIRTCSLPTETEEDWRKRKELQTLRRMEAKRKRSEKQRNWKISRERSRVFGEEEEATVNGIFQAENCVQSWVNGGKGANCNIAVKVGVGVGGGEGSLLLPPAAPPPPLQPPQPSQGSIGSSQGSGSSGISEFESQPFQDPSFLVILLDYAREVVGTVHNYWITRIAPAEETNILEYYAIAGLFVAEASTLHTALDLSQQQALTHGERSVAWSRIEVTGGRFMKLPVIPWAKGLNKCTEAISPSSVQSMLKSEHKSPTNPEATTAEKSSKVAGVPMKNELNKTTAAEKGMKEVVRNVLEDMPCVSTTGDGPNGKRIDGFLYRYRKGEEVRIVCVCHGSFLSPAEFVKHAGGGDVAHPLKHIVVNPSALL
ncbi:hypothetical protein Pint_19049 [Pistacia integerrima]|uniref:Uncharacterized protein n=1 Tax=Pistacia integerrima TaxID=434235 RepID=A0ACC0YXU8_9ROSI|nr:hypothetical protein Pint_19049 [Pistacia integerrima]